MFKKEVTRRDFINKTTTGLIGGASITICGSGVSAASYRSIIGANERLNIGFLGCGSRSSNHQSMVKTSEKNKNLAVVAVCDIWKNNKIQPKKVNNSL